LNIEKVKLPNFELISAEKGNQQKKYSKERKESDYEVG